MAQKKIWQVKGNGPATTVHRFRKQAENEARRLAAANPGQDFYVMEAVAVHRNVSTTRYAFDDLDEDGSIPF